MNSFDILCSLRAEEISETLHVGEKVIFCVK